PQLTPAQVGRISGVGERRRVRSGEVLYELGEQNTRFFVVIEGAIEIVRPIDGREERITVHGPGEFTGEINMLSARRTLVCGPVPGGRGGRAGGRGRERPGAEEPCDRGPGRRAWPEPQARRRDDEGRGDRRRRTGGSRRRRLRGVGGTRRAGARGYRARRPGR